MVVAIKFIHKQKSDIKYFCITIEKKHKNRKNKYCLYNLLNKDKCKAVDEEEFWGFKPSPKLFAVSNYLCNIIMSFLAYPPPLEIHF